MAYIYASDIPLKMFCSYISFASFSQIKNILLRILGLIWDVCLLINALAHS